MRTAALALGLMLLAGHGHAALLGHAAPATFGPAHSTFSQRSAQAHDAPAPLTQAAGLAGAALDRPGALLLLAAGIAATAYGRRRRY